MQTWKGLPPYEISRVTIIDVNQVRDKRDLNSCLWNCIRCIFFLRNSVNGGSLRRELIISCFQGTGLILVYHLIFFSRTISAMLDK